MKKNKGTGRKHEHLKPWHFQPGQSGNPLGRPPGRSLKDRAKAYLSGLTDDEAVEFFEGMDKKDVWEMAEGKASQGVDLSGKVDVGVELTDEQFERLIKQYREELDSEKGSTETV